MWEESDADPDKIGAGEAVLMQWTGLKDAQGTDIYEGDILGFKKSNGEFVSAGTVTYGTCGGGGFEESFNTIGFYLEHAYGTDGLCDFSIERYEVMGNIYQNPELLK